MTKADVSLELNLNEPELLGRLPANDVRAASHLFYLVRKVTSPEENVVCMTTYPGEMTDGKGKIAPSTIEGVAEVKTYDETATIAIEMLDDTPQPERAIAALAITAAQQLPCEPSEVFVQLHQESSNVTDSRLTNLVHQYAA